MAKKLKEYQIMKNLRGMQLTFVVCAFTKKDAIVLFDITNGFMSDYGLTYEPQHKECIENPQKVFVYFDSGELRYSHPTLWNVPLPVSEMASLIDEHRKVMQQW